MTRNQIDYWKHMEDKRHNVSTESETNRHNVATEGIDLGKLQETSRHNQTTELIDMGKLNETTRHNKVTESQGGVDLSIKAGQLAEQQRHNTVSEAVDKYQAQTSAGRAEYQNSLDQARADLARVEGLLNMNRSDLTQAQIREIEAKIKQWQQQIALEQQQLITNSAIRGTEAGTKVSSEIRRWLNLNPFD